MRHSFNELPSGWRTTVVNRAASAARIRSAAAALWRLLAVTTSGAAAQPDGAGRVRNGCCWPAICAQLPYCSPP